jgi:hypothetical protein
MPQAIKLVDAEDRSCIYVPITQDGKVVDTRRRLAAINASNSLSTDGRIPAKALNESTPRELTLR